MSKIKSALWQVLTILAGAAFLAMLVWMRFAFSNPQAEAEVMPTEAEQTDVQPMESVMPTEVVETPEPEETKTPIHYVIDEDAVVAPCPNEQCFGETDNPEVVAEVILQAQDLLAGQSLVWNEDIERMPGSTIKYYFDETLLVICWKEAINGSAVSFAEIKTADGSQLRRAVAGNEYGSGLHMKATEMAAAANAVVAINGDFYDYRRIGITTYQRKVYRVAPEKVESAYFTSSGDMIFSHMGELSGEGEAQRFVDENDVVFGIAFGPIMVEDGELRQNFSYIMGETRSEYSRAAIAQTDELHYLLMTIGQEGNYWHRMTMNAAAEIIYGKGVKNAYALDGGQTATIVFKDETFNRVDWDTERTMSDIIYFATAIPDKNGGTDE